MWSSYVVMLPRRWSLRFRRGKAWCRPMETVKRKCESKNWPLLRMTVVSSQEGMALCTQTTPMATMTRKCEEKQPLLGTKIVLSEENQGM